MTKSIFKKRERTTARALVSFIELTKIQQDDFIASMNDFLIASQKNRREMIEELRDSCESEKSIAEIGKFQPTGT